MNKQIIIAVLIVLGVAFYWFEIKPSIAKKQCYKEATDASIGQGSDNFDKLYQQAYQHCLNQRGY